MPRKPNIDDLPLTQRIEAREKLYAQELVRIERAAKEYRRSPVYQPRLDEKVFTGSVSTWQDGKAQLPDSSYQTFAREGYMRNPLVYACIRELATSAAEPEMMFRRGQQWLHQGEVIDFLNRPNPFMSRFTFYSTVIMYRSIAGNAYALKVRSRSGRLIERWLLRPDRVKVVPSKANYISHYEYTIDGSEKFELPAEDVIHYKDPHPLNDWYGMPPLMAASGHTDIDNYMADFVKSFFMNAGIPGGIMTVKARLGEGEIDRIQDNFRMRYGGPRSWHDLLVLDNTEATYTPMTMSLGTRGLVVPELDEIEEARICSVFGVPQSLVGTRTSYQNGGYANKQAEEEHFWTGTLMPLYKDIAGQETLSLAPEFAGVTEIAFDMSTVEALQEDLDKVADRWARLAQFGLASVQEAREKVGLPREWDNGHVFLVPGSSIGVSGEDLADPGTGAEVPDTRQEDGTGQPSADVQAQALNGAQISSLLTLLQSVTAGMLAPETAIQMLIISFPSISPEQVRALVSSAAAFTPETPETPEEPAPVGATNNGNSSNGNRP